MLPGLGPTFAGVGNPGDGFGRDSPLSLVRLSPSRAPASILVPHPSHSVDRETGK